MRKIQMNHTERQKLREIVVEQVKQGRDVRELAKLYGRSYEWVVLACKEAGVKVRRSYLTWNTYQIISDLLNTSDTYQAIADRHQAIKQQIHEIAMKMVNAGIVMPHRSISSKKSNGKPKRSKL